LKLKLRMMLDIGMEFTAIFTESGNCGEIYEILKSAGKKIPEDISLITQEDGVSLQFMNDYGTNPTRLVKPLPKIGRMAAETIVKLIKEKTASPTAIVFDWEMSEGNSCRKLSGSKIKDFS